MLTLSSFAVAMSDPATNVDIDAIRAQMEQEETRGSAALPLIDGLEEFWTTIALPDGWVSKTLVIRPKSLSGSNPLIVAWHGGGWFLGSPNMCRRPGREWAQKYGAVVVCPSYKLSPENPFPAPTKSAWDIMVDISKSAESVFGANLDAGLIVSGWSAGGNLAAVITGISLCGDSGDLDHEELAKPLTGAFLNCPLLLTDGMIPQEYKHDFTSLVDNCTSEGLDSAGVKMMYDFLAPNIHSPWYSAFNAIRLADERNISYATTLPIYIQVAQLDPLRDDGILFSKFVASKGFKTKLDIFSLDGHIGWTTMPLPSKSVNPTPEEATMAAIEWIMSQ